MLPPWKAAEVTRKPAVDAIACCAVPRDAGPPDWAPVSERYPLPMCRHFVAGLSIGMDDATGDPDTVDGFYAARGVYVVSTVEDGDCALDCMLKMCEEVSTAETRGQLREDTCLLPSPPLPQEFCVAVGETTVDGFFSLCEFFAAIPLRLLHPPPPCPSTNPSLRRSLTTSCGVCGSPGSSTRWWSPKK